jgi:hypothetical protein
MGGVTLVKRLSKFEFKRASNACKADFSRKSVLGIAFAFDM